MGGSDPVFAIIIFAIIGGIIYMKFNHISFKDLWLMVKGGFK